MDDFKIAGTAVKIVSFKPNLATTSTKDSGRTMDGVMHNTPMFTVESYALELADVSLELAAIITSAYVNKSKLSMTLLTPYTGTVQTKDFYISNSSLQVGKLTDDLQYWDSISFNAVGVNPI